MRRIRLRVSYDGTDYCGSQIQPNGVTIEEKLNAAVQKLTGQDVQVIFASRTDTGVHALGNVAVFDTEMRMDAGKFAFALNQRLPEDIRVRASDEVALNWHPRKQNCIKSYEYRIFNSRIPNPLLRRYAQFCYYALDVEAMREAAQALVGEHDFAAFCSSGSSVENTVRRIHSAEIEEKILPAGEWERQETGQREGRETRRFPLDRVITIRLRGSGFLYNMVRIIAGTLIEIGSGRRPAADMQHILRSRNRQESGAVAAACGLTLCSIQFLPALLPLIEAENEDWSYTLDQSMTTQSGESRLTIRRCNARDYAALLTRLLHETHRNGAKFTLVRDLEQPERLKPEQRYGYYRLFAKEGAFPFRAEDCGGESGGTFLALCQPLCINPHECRRPHTEEQI